MKFKMALSLAVVCVMMSGAPIYAANGDKPVDLAADVLEYDMESGLLTATGSVKMIQDGAVLTGSAAQYNSKTKEGRVTGNVFVKKEDLTMKAAQVVTEGNNHLVATGDVVVTKADRVLTGPKVDYYIDKEYAVIPENPKVTMPDGTMTANKLEAYMKENHMVATGNVHIVSETRNLDATADKALYYGQEKGKVILEGNAVAVQDNNTLRGNTLTLYLAGAQKAAGK